MKTCILSFLVLADAVIAQESNPCNICPDGVTIPEGNDWIPYSNSNVTCAMIVQDALSFESGTDDCGWEEIRGKLECCPPTEIANPCNLCPDGITNAAGDGHFPASWPDYTCKTLTDEALQYEAGSDACSYYDDIVPDCCPPPTISPTIAPTEASPSTSPPSVVTPYPTYTTVVGTLAPTPESTVGTTLESSTTTTIENR